MCVLASLLQANFQLSPTSHSFIPSTCAECDNSLPFSGASSIPLCYVLFSSHPSLPIILPSSLTSSCHLFLGPPLNLVVPKFIYVGEPKKKTRFFHERFIYLKNYKKFISPLQSTLHWMICTYPISVSTVRNISGTPQGGCCSALLSKLR